MLPDFEVINQFRVNLLHLIFSGFADEPLSVVSDNGDVVFSVIDAGTGKNPELRISKAEILFSNVDSFKVIDPVSPLYYIHSIG